MVGPDRKVETTKFGEADEVRLCETGGWQRSRGRSARGSGRPGRLPGAHGRNQAGQDARVLDNSESVLVKPNGAAGQMEADVEVKGGDNGGRCDRSGEGGGGGEEEEEPGGVDERVRRRLHGSVKLDPLRIGRDAGTVDEEVVQYLSGLAGADVEVTLEIRADVPDGVPDKVVRDVTENCHTLKFESQGFEEA